MSTLGEQLDDSKRFVAHLCNVHGTPNCGGVDRCLSDPVPYIHMPSFRSCVGPPDCLDCAAIIINPAETGLQCKRCFHIKGSTVADCHCHCHPALIDLPGVGVVGDSMTLKDILWDVVKLWDIGAFTVESAFRESAQIAMERLKRAHLEMR